MFREDKATALGAFFLEKAGQKDVDRFDLLKFMYATERYSLRDRACLIVGDRFYHMKMGPVMSSTLDCMRGDTDSLWGKAMFPDGAYLVKLVESPVVPDVLTAEEIAWAEESWQNYQQILDMDINSKVEFMHSEFPEWRNPAPSTRENLTISEIAEKGLGWDEEEAMDIEDTIRNIESMMSYSRMYA
jgi:hypothetical protein